MADQSYLFVDGAYLRQRHSDMMSAVFGKIADFDLSNLRQNLVHLTPLGTRDVFQRVFYYDCLHDIPKVGESDEELKARDPGATGILRQDSITSRLPRKARQPFRFFTQDAPERG